MLHNKFAIDCLSHGQIIIEITRMTMSIHEVSNVEKGLYIQKRGRPTVNDSVRRSNFTFKKHIICSHNSLFVNPNWFILSKQ